MPSKRVRRLIDLNKPKDIRIEWNDSIKLALIEGFRNEQRLKFINSGFK